MIYLDHLKNCSEYIKAIYSGAETSQFTVAQEAAQRLRHEANVLCNLIAIKKAEHESRPKF